MKRSRFIHHTALAGAGLSLSSLPSCAPKSAPRNDGPSPEPFAFEESTIAELQQAMDAGQLTSVALTRAHLQRIESLDHQGPRLNAVIALNPEALAIAESLDQERRAGKTRGPFHGLPVLVKDNLDTHDRMSTTAGSLALADSIAPRDSTVVERLRAAGLVILGKTNLSEWANFRSHHSTSGWSGLGGQTRNPYCLDRDPSGSSSGSAAAVAANFAPLAIGTETNGSIVSPSSCCGVVGIKPTVGLVSRAGIIPISSSQDTAGPIARTVTDAAALLAIILGDDPRDAATQRSLGKTANHIASLLAPQPMPTARLGIARRHFQLHPQVDPVFEKALNDLRGMGAHLIDPIQLPSLAALRGADQRVMLYEFKAGLNDYFTSLGSQAQVKNLDDLIAFNQREAAKELRLFGQEILIEAARMGPLTDPDYLEAKAHCQKWSEALEALMDEHQLDAIIAPTRGPAATLDIIHGDHGLGGISSYPAIAGLPHITVPCGHIFGLPVGLSFFGRAWSEPTLVNIALAFEQATHARQAPKFLSTLEIPESL